MKKQLSLKEIPTHRVMIDRRTGQEVGPRVPIDPKDWPLSDIDNAETLWRYMCVSKLEDLLATSTLWFSRPDRFDDPFEGLLAVGGSSELSDTDKALHNAYQLNQTVAEREQQLETHRRCVFISCWHRNTQESQEMWKAYTPQSDSVVVVTSVKALRYFLPGEIMKSPVKYHTSDYVRPMMSWNMLFFYKPSTYSFEREFRMLRSLDQNESVSFDDPKDFGRRVPVNLKKIIHRVVTHPKASKSVKAKVDALLAVYLKGIRRENSAFER